MKLKRRGKSILKAEVAHISEHGLWIIVLGKEYFLPFQEFPWFENAAVKSIYNFSLIHGNYLRWPDLDVDLALASLENLEKYPLIYR